MLTLILGPSGSGKSVRLREELRQRARSRQRSILIVPEQFTSSTEGALYHALGDELSAYVESYSFTSLAETLLRRYGGAAVPTLSEAGRAVLVRRAMDEMMDKVVYYSRQRRSAAFCQKAAETISELKSAGIRPETLADYAPTTRDTDILTEYVRQSLKRAISTKYFPSHETTSVLTLDPKIEQEVMGSVKQTETGAFLNLDPARSKAILNAVGEEIKKLENMGKTPIIMTSPIVRMYFKRLTEDYYPDLVVVSYNEVESNVELQSVGMVTA